MNKQDFKKVLEKEFYILSYNEVDGPITLENIEKKTNTEEAVIYIENYFKKLINYFENKGLSCDELNLLLSFSLIVLKENMDAFFQIKQGKKPLIDLVKVYVCYSYGKDDDKKTRVDSSFIFEDSFKEFIVSFNKYISLLKDRGFELEGINSFDEVLNLILSDQNAMTKVSLKLNKPKKKERVLK